jgi:hypothetical protein
MRSMSISGPMKTPLPESDLLVITLNQHFCIQYRPGWSRI